ncbi:hypothetical protein HDV00_011643 [Rhizophlyctis rosea]|nr:hypothetical protein HDV00_011643 [Rhizophlyctis rosea]
MEKEIEVNPLHSRKRVSAILERVTKAGGVPLSSAKKYQYTTWFRTLATRGCATASTVSDPEVAKRAFRESFPNPGTRTHYTRAMLVYIQGLTDEEYAVEYPKTPRHELVQLVNDITREAGMERRKGSP